MKATKLQFDTIHGHMEIRLVEGSDQRWTSEANVAPYNENSRLWDSRPEAAEALVNALRGMADQIEKRIPAIRLLEAAGEL